MNTIQSSRELVRACKINIEDPDDECRDGKCLVKKEETYKNRQAIVEHPYETIKRQWGVDLMITKRKIACAEADIGLIKSACNLR